MNYAERGRFARLIDRTIAAFSPGSAVKREIARQKLHYFRYAGATNTRNRVQNTQNLQSAESPQYARDRIQMIKEARNLEENSEIAQGILGRFQTHVTGSLQWQPQTGSKRVNAKISEWFSDWSKRCDHTGRHGLRKLVEIALRQTLTDGDCGLVPFIDSDGEAKVIGIEGDRIGNPHDTTPRPGYVNGIILDSKNAPIGYRVFERDAYGQFLNPEDIPAQNFCHVFNANRFDRYRGVTAFAAVINTAVDVQEIIEFEKLAVKWGSMRTAIVTGSPGGPDSTQFFDDGAQGETTERRRIEEVMAGQINYIDGADMKIEQFKTERPNASWEGFLQFLIRLFSVGTCLPYGFVFDIASARGPGARFEALQADRVFKMWQRQLAEQALDKIKNIALTGALANREIPIHNNYLKGRWQFPSESTIDIGRESAADVNEVKTGLKSMASVLKKHAVDDFEERERIALEMRHWMDLAEQHNVPLAALIGSDRAGAMQAQAEPKPESPEEANGKGFMQPIIVNEAERNGKSPVVDVKTAPIHLHMREKGDEKPVVKKSISFKRERGKIVSADVLETPVNGEQATKRVALSKGKSARVDGDTIIEYQR